MSTLQVTTIQSSNSSSDITIQSANTNAGALVIAANGSGLQMKANSTTNIMTVNTSGITFANTTLTGISLNVASNTFSVGGQGISPYVGFAQKNRIINSQFRIDQRYAGAVTNCGNTGGFLGPDRWWVFSVKSSANYPTFQCNTTPVGPYWGFFDWKNHATTGSTGAASDVFLLYQAIEGLNMVDLQWGTANAQPATISWLCSTSQDANLTLTIRSSNADKSYLVPFTTNSTWQYYTATIPGPTSGTWYSNSSSGGSVGIDWGSGSTYTNSTINSWISGNYVSATGSTKLANVLSSNVKITAVQFEKGTVNTAFEFIPFGREVDNCLRYYKVYSGTFASYAPGATVTHWLTWNYHPHMRDVPSTSISLSGGGNYAAYGMIVNTAVYSTMQVNSTAAGMVSYNYTLTANAEMA